MLKDMSRDRVIGFVLLTVILASLIGYLFIFDKSMKMKTTVQAPGLSYGKHFSNMYIDFSMPSKAKKRYPVAPLKDMNKEVHAGISISPAISGSWHWYDEDRITFTPKQDWPANQTYKIHMNETLFAKGALEVDDFDLSFKTPAFKVETQSISFEQGSKEVKGNKVFATLSFTHRVNQKSLADNIKLYEKPSNVQIPFTLNYDEEYKTAYVQSNTIEIGDKEKYIHLEVGPEVQSELGKSRFNAKAQAKILIPDIYSFLKVEHMRYEIIENKEGEPEQILHLSFTDAISKAFLTQYLSLKAMVKKGKKEIEHPFTPIYLENENYFSKDYFIKTELPVQGYMDVKLKEGLPSQNGFKLRRDVKERIYIPSYPREVKIMGEGSLLASTGDKTLSIMARGLPALQVSVQKLMDNQINHLISQTYGDITSPSFRTYEFSADNITQKRLEKIIKLNKTHPKDRNYASFDLSAYMKKQGSGIFFVKVSDWNTRSNRPEHYVSDTRMIVVTDLGLVVKKAQDGSRDVFVESIFTGKAVGGAYVSVLGKNGQVIKSVKTSASGKASFPKLDDYRDEQEPTVFVAKQGKSISFIPYSGFSRQLDYSQFDVGGIRQGSQGNKKALSAFAFSDRGIYRPGEKVQLGAIIRQGDFFIQEGLVIKAKVYDSRSQLLLEKKIKLDKSGFFELDLQTHASSNTGRYTYSLYLPNKYNDTYLGGAKFAVEEFQADTMKIKTSITPHVIQGWSKTTGLEAKVELLNLFGTPAQNRRVKAKLEIVPQHFSFSQYQGFSFKDPFLSKDAKRTEVIAFNDIKTDKQGMARFEIKMPVYDGGTYVLKFSAEGFEPDGGRSVSAKSSVLVSPLDTMVGVKVDGDLNYLKKGQDRSLEFVAIDANLTQVNLHELSLEYILNKRISVLTKQPNGTYRYETVIKKEEMSKKDFSITTHKTKIKLNTQKGGFYTVNIKDKTNVVLASIDYEVVSRGNMTGALEKNSELSIKLDKGMYKAGESIEMNIVAPYTGTGLITIESDKVHAHKWFKTEAKSSIQKISIPSYLEGNAYVSVSFVRSIDSKEIFASPLSYAVEPFKIDLKKREVDISLDVPSLVKPGEALKISYHTDKPSKIVIYAVNEGILQVAGYKLPKPLNHFLKKRALGVSTFQILDLILPEYSRFVELAGIGGGIAESKMMKRSAGANLNPFKRTLDAPAVYWSGIVNADTSAKAVSFIVPDSFSGNMKIMAVAVADKAMGSASADTLVRGPFVLSPNVLNVAAPKDEFDISLGIMNGIKGSGRDAEISISLAISDNLSVLGDNSKKINISEGDEGKVSFRLKALDALGEGSIVFTAKYKDKSLTRSASLSIRPSQMYTTTVQAKYDKAGAVHEFRVPRELYSELSTQNISASSSPLVLASGLTQYLEKYPHGCTEQIISQVMPWVSLAELSAFSELAQKKSEHAQKVLVDLQARQLGNGSFSLWPSSSYNNKFTSLYAMHFITEVKDSSLSSVYVPRTLYKGGMDYLREVARGETNQMNEARLRAIAIYLLVRNKEVATNYLVDLHEDLSKNHKGWEKDILSAYMAASYKMLMKHKIADELISKFDAKMKTEHTDFQSDITMGAQYVYLVAKHFPKKNLDIVNNIMPLVQPVLSGRLNTISSSYTTLALSAYSQRNTDLYGEDKLEFYQKAKVKSPLAIKTDKPFKMAEIPINIKNVGVETKSELFYILTQSGFARTAYAHAKALGIEVYREYVDVNGTVITEFTQGQDVEVRLKVRSLDKPYLDNIVLVDLLPGGFEVIRNSVPRESGRFSADYTDIREDRVVYYGRFFDSMTELRYKVKVTASGKFVVPSASAKSMYDSSVHSHTASAMATVHALP